MVRRRWPDVIIVVGILALGGFGVWALWGDELGRWVWPSNKPDIEDIEVPVDLT